MKRIIVGRGTDCDIIIQDSSETVSRHHLVISINFFGKMTISDTSSNGTSVNGRRITKGVSLSVSRDDSVRLGDAANLDWNRVEDPYSKHRKITLIGLIIVVLIGIGFGISSVIGQKKHEREMIEISDGAADEESGEWNRDSTENVAPTKTSIETGEKKQTQKKAVRASSHRKKADSKPLNKNKGNNASAPDGSESPNRINETDRQILPQSPKEIRSRDHSTEKE